MCKYVFYFIFHILLFLKIFLGFPFYQSGCCDSRLMFSFQDVKAKWGGKTCLKTFLLNKKDRALEIKHWENRSKMFQI